MLDNKLCHFKGYGLYCGILEDVKCNGVNKKCSFFKTARQYQEDLDKAILINRRKHRCESCKYNKDPCILSTENIKICRKEKQNEKDTYTF